MSLRFFILALAAAGFSAAQPPDVALRSTTRLVQVEVVVRDAEGKLVTGLKQGDFEIFEDKKPQKLSFFNDHRQYPRPAVSLPPGMLSNRPEITGPRRGVTVILVDSLNTPWSARARAYGNLMEFLKGAHPDDRVALYTLGHRFRVFHDFTGSADSLRARLARQGTPTLAAIGEEPQLDQVIPEVAALARWAQDNEDSIRLVARATATFKTIEAIANHLGSTPGWKSLVWISGGFPLQVGMDRSANATEWKGMKTTTGELRSFDAEFDQAIKALTHSNVAVYPIDPRGLQGLPEFESTGQRLARSDRPWQETDAMLTRVARRTGGKAYVGLNDILGSLRDVTETAQASYTLAYYPANTADDGKYRRIDVRLKQPGLAASHREGYFALDEAARISDPQKEMLAAARDPLDSAVIGIDAHLRKTPEGLRITARVDVHELLWDSGSGLKVETAAGVYQFDAGGRMITSVVDHVQFQCAPRQAAALAQQGMSYDRPVTLDPAAARVRLVVRSSRTGAMGSITLPVAP